MKKIISGDYRISKFWTLIICSIIITLLVGYWYFADTFYSYPKFNPIVSGLLVGLVFLILQLFLSKYELTNLDFIERLGVINVFRNRKDQKQYGELINEAQNEIIVLGVTASRMMEDFASEYDKQCMQLRTALSKGVKVKIMLCKSENLNEKDRSRIETTTLPIVQKLKEIHSNLEIKFYEGQGNHSIFKVDDKCIVGPIFAGDNSKDTPSIVMKTDSEYVKPYLEYFKKIWDDAK